MTRNHVLIKEYEFKQWLNRHGIYKEYSDKQYAKDIQNWKEETGRRDAKIDELCYIILLGRGVCLKFYSTIDQLTGLSRDRGEDSIKIVVAYEESLAPARGKITHTYRLPGWRDNLNANLIKALEQLWGKQKLKCGRCKTGKLIIRKVKEKTMLGCSNYFHINPSFKCQRPMLALEEMWSR